MSKKKNIGLFFIILMLLTSSFSFATIVNYTVTNKYQQEKSNWCWNAASRTAAKYRYNVTLSQTEMAAKIFPFSIDKNKLATLQQTGAALTLYTNSTKGTGYSTDLLSFDYAYTKLTESKTPVVVGVFNSWGDGHALTVYKMDDVSKKIGVIDPYDMGVIYDTWDSYGPNFDWTFEGVVYYLKGQW